MPRPPLAALFKKRIADSALVPICVSASQIAGGTLAKYRIRFPLYVWIVDTPIVRCVRNSGVAQVKLRLQAGFGDCVDCPQNRQNRKIENRPVPKIVPKSSPKIVPKIVPPKN